MFNSESKDSINDSIQAYPRRDSMLSSVEEKLANKRKSNQDKPD